MCKLRIIDTSLTISKFTIYTELTLAIIHVFQSISRINSRRAIISLHSDS